LAPFWVIYFITVNYYSTKLITRLWDSIQSQVGGVEYQLIVINNSPEDRQIRGLDGTHYFILEAKHNLGFGGGCNLGLSWVFEHDPRAIAWLINPDTILPQGSLEKAIQFCKNHANFSIIGPVIYQSNSNLGIQENQEEQGTQGEIWFAGGEFIPETGRIMAKTDWSQDLARDYWPTTWVTGCSMLLNLGCFADCPQFDPDYFLYYEDFDFCRRYALQGHSLVVTSQIQVIHSPSSITNRNPRLKFQHSTYSYLLALERHTGWQVVLYRLSRILLHGIRVGFVDPPKAIGIIKGVLNYLVRVSRFGQSISR
jgi:GT2 family glycosyltransferase